MATENIGGAGVSGNPNAASSSRSNSTADSYIGSLISLTSKSEIRYEGVLYNINTEESSIGLRNVRSFGTEGRKKDGPQIPASDKVYEYILFRGSDIKDLQVKSSPPVQPTPPIHNDPAIIQSHYPRPVPSSTTLPSAAAAAAGSLSDIGSLNAPMGLTGSNFQGGLPLYQPGGNLATWGASPPPPTANGSGLAMPMYWQGYYGPPNALPQHLHQQSLLRPPPGLSMPASLQQPLQYPNFNAPLPSGNSTLPNANLSASNVPVSTLPGSNLPVATSSASSLPVSSLPASTLPEIPNPLLPVGTNAHTLTSTPSVPSTLPSALPLLPSSTLASETLPSLLANKAPSAALPVANLSTSLPSLSPLTTTSPEINTMVPPISNKPATLSTPSIPYQNSMQSISSGAVASNSLRVETPTPPLVTPGQLLQSGLAPSQTVQEAHKDVEVVQVSSSSPPEASVPIAAESKPPILPLPAPSRATHRVFIILLYKHYLSHV
ncbi:hypothetical protein Tsubulata_033843 [Turnera subulata]|uniref:Sm domain-containing protein n=1 Tax=Turnera subulata TaxID=218843 RepID=A0A9Q0FP70_9ROSI|nr:hypothetical protein Tsubulata_033843 [Turnera subulata]